MGEKMSFERLRDWHRRVNKEWNTATLREQMQLVVEFPHGLAATFLDAHLTQPAQAVDVGAIRDVIGELEGYCEASDDSCYGTLSTSLVRGYTSKLTAALAHTGDTQ